MQFLRENKAWVVMSVVVILIGIALGLWTYEDVRSFVREALSQLEAWSG